MAFKPPRGQNYYIFPKLIDPSKDTIMAVATSGTNPGAAMQLKPFNATDSNQQFRFEPGQGGRFYWILMHDANYLAVHASLQTNGAPVIHWQWQPGSPNLYFEFFPAGNGYYRIMASHSQKFLDVQSSLKASGTPIIQWERNMGENQLFRLVPIPNQKTAASSVTFAENNNYLRTGILAVIGQAPEVGAGLKFIVGFFWKGDDSLSNLWEQMKSYVDKRIQVLLDAQRLTDMTDLLAGYLKLIHKIQKSPGLKGDELMKTVINPLIVKEPAIQKNAVQLLPYIVSFGSIMISLWHSIVVDYKTLYGHDAEADVYADNIENLRRTIREYTEAVGNCVQSAKDWRMRMIPDAQTISESKSWRHTKWTNHTSTAHDDFDGWKQSWWCRTGHQPEGITNHRARAEFAVAQRRRQVEAQFESEINEFVRPARFWQYFDPEKPRYVPATVRKEVGIFGGMDATSAFTSTDGKKITNVYFHWWKGGNLCGFELYMDGQTLGVWGCRGNEAHHMPLENDEYITSVEGFDNGNITGLWFATQKGKIGGGGAVTGTYFSGDLADSFNARVVKITGAHDGGSLQQISFTWEYID